MRNGIGRMESSGSAFATLDFAILFLPLARPYGPRFFGDVDADRAPDDAAPTANAARRIELVEPTGQLVRHPLAVRDFVEERISPP